MFTLKEINSIDTDYFRIIQSGSYTITLQSKNTCHCWHIISVQSYKDHFSCQIYHTHREYTPYHFQATVPRISEAIAMIKKHDDYQLRKIHRKTEVVNKKNRSTRISHIRHRYKNTRTMFVKRFFLNIVLV